MSTEAAKALQTTWAGRKGRVQSEMFLAHHRIICIVVAALTTHHPANGWHVCDIDLGCRRLMFAEQSLVMNRRHLSVRSIVTRWPPLL
jgi:hypothetical protein